MQNECICKSRGKVDDQQFCIICGQSEEGLQLVNEVGFMNQNVVGTFGSQSGTHSNFRGFAKDIRLKKAQKFSKMIGTELNLSQLQQQQGMRLFKWAQHNNFTHGRHTSNVMATCLYIVCRQQKTPHLLIDFADTLGINLYQLGATFLKMANLLHFEGEKLPIIDPSLFIHRFCNRLDFGAQQNQVAITALKLLARMKRDWMCYGRRPTSLCGASILIAARYHGFKRTTGQIVSTVRVCDETIRKRLEEFKKTQVARLTREEFERLDLEKDLEEELDPPSFRKALQKSNQMIQDIHQEQIERKLQEKAQVIEKQLINNQIYLDNQDVQQEEGQVNSQILLVQQQPQPQIHQKQEEQMNYSDVNLSDISDSEIDQLILSPEEKTLKSIMWHKMHKDWLQEQLIKKQLKDKAKKTGKRRSKKSNQVIDALDAVQAITHYSKIKDRVNQELLQEVFDFDIHKKVNQHTNISI